MWHASNHKIGYLNLIVYGILRGSELRQLVTREVSAGLQILPVDSQVEYSTNPSRVIQLKTGVLLIERVL